MYEDTRSIHRHHVTTPPRCGDQILTAESLANATLAGALARRAESERCMALVPKSSSDPTRRWPTARRGPAARGPGNRAAGPGVSPVVVSGSPRIITGYSTSELGTTAANSFLAAKICFISAWGMCEAIGGDATQLADAICYDRPIASSSSVPASASGRVPAQGQLGVHRPGRRAGLELPQKSSTRSTMRHQWTMPGSSRALRPGGRRLDLPHAWTSLTICRRADIRRAAAPLSARRRAWPRLVRWLHG